MNATQSTVSLVARRLVTAAMLGCFLLAGWSWIHESSPQTQQAHAAVLRPAQAVEKRLAECHGCLSRANVENRSDHSHGSESRGTTVSTQPLADSRSPVNSSPLAIDDKAARSTTEPRYVTKNIEDIRAGDYVLAREEHGEKIALRKVVEVYRRTSYHLRHLTFESEDGRSQTLQTTDEHPFWSVSRNAWVDAGDFQVGEQVTSPAGDLQTLTATHRTTHPEGFPVFNFQVGEYHTYFVTQSTNSKPLLVHNADHAYRVMSTGEFLNAQRGAWADSTLVAGTQEAGNKWLWASEKSADKWKRLMEANGETNLVIAKVPLLKDSNMLPRFPHSPEGTALFAPFDVLGAAQLVR